MKRSVSVVLVILVAFALGACRRSEQPAAPAAPVQAAAPAPTTATAPAAAVSTVAELPDYPGATLVKTEPEARAGFSKGIEAKFTSTDTFENVTKFYAAAIAASGWQVTRTEPKRGEMKWHLAKGTSTGRVEVETEHGLVKIKLERNDK